MMAVKADSVAPHGLPEGNCSVATIYIYIYIYIHIVRG